MRVATSMWKSVTHLRSDESAQYVWDNVFHPTACAWENNIELYKEKQESVVVLFRSSSYFLKGGLAVIKQFVELCDSTVAIHKDSNYPTSTHYNPSYSLDTSAKIFEFLKYRVALAANKWTDDSKVLKEESMLNAFVTAIPHLNAVSMWQGYGVKCMECENISVFKTKLLKLQQQARINVQDYASNSRFLTKRLHSSESTDILKCWWDGSACKVAAKSSKGQQWVQVRGLLLHCLQQHIGRRGEDLRNIKLSMLFCHSLSQTLPIPNAPVVGVSLRHVKECKDNIEHLLGWTRAKDRLSCPLGALAMYLVYMNDVEGPNIINIIDRDIDSGTHKWRELQLLQGLNTSSNRTTPLSYTTHSSACHAGLVAANVTDKTASTHLWRTSLACDLMERGVEINDVGLYQGWFHNTAADRYLRASFKTHPMLISHGWSNGVNGFECWWEGDSDVPCIIQELVFPGLDNVVRKCSNSKDTSLSHFLNCLVLLRRIYIQDATVKQKQYPTFPAYARHPLFKHGLYTEWLQTVCKESKLQESRKSSYILGQQRDVIDAIKIAMQEMQNNTKPESAVLSPSQVFTKPPEPTNTGCIPDIPEPEDLFLCYQYWVTTLKPYFERTVRPPWKQQFGDSAHAMKQRFCRLRPYYSYLDKYEDKIVIRGVIDKLDSIRMKYNLTSAAFIKQCFYCLTHPVTPSKPPPISPDILKKHMLDCELRVCT